MDTTNDINHKLTFKPKSRLLLQLGDQLIKNEKVAISELVKNSYDACARYAIVELFNVHTDEYNTKGKIVITDDGKGMDKKTIESIWMEPGTNNKEKFKKNFLKNIQEDDELCKRIPIGEKGIGRFGVHKLGFKIKLVSKKLDSKEIELNIDWTEFEKDTYLSDESIILIEKEKPELFMNNTTGTIITVEKIRKQWSKSEIRDIYRSLQSLTSPFSSNDDFIVDFHIDKEELLHGLFDAEQLAECMLWHFKCDVFKNNAGNSEIGGFSYLFEPYSRMDKDRIAKRTVLQNDNYIDNDKLITLEIVKTVDDKRIIEYQPVSLEGIGNFSIEGYIFDLDTKTLDQSSISDRKGIKSYLKENGGVRVYRENLRVYDYGESENDWLGLNQRRINDPSTSIGNNQILATVNLKMKESNGLIETTNREGFVENIAYENLKEAVKFVLDKVAFLRNEDKDKIRAIHVKEVDTTESTYSLINILKSDIQKYIEETKIKNKLINTLDQVQTNYEDLKELLLKSSGTGLTYGIVTHQMQKIVSEIKHRVKNSNEDIQSLVNSLDASIESIMNLFVVSKKTDVNVATFIKSQKNMFNYRLKKHGIEYIQGFSDDNTLTMHIAENFVSGTFLNVIDNSIYWLDYWQKTNKPNENKKIRIDILDSEKYVKILISDNGLGFLINPETAVMPFKTTKKRRDRGTGIGLYYSSEAMKINEGSFEIPYSKHEKESLGLEDGFLRGATVILKLPKGKQ